MNHSLLLLDAFAVHPGHPVSRALSGVLESAAAGCLPRFAQWLGLSPGEFRGMLDIWFPGAASAGWEPDPPPVDLAMLPCEFGDIVEMLWDGRSQGADGVHVRWARASPFNALHPPSWRMAAPARPRPGDAPGVQQGLEARTAFGVARGHATRRRQGPAGQAEQALGLRHVVSGRKVFDDAHLPGGFQCTREFGSGEAARAGELVAAQGASIPQAGHQREYTIPGWSFHGGYVGRTCPAAQSFWPRRIELPILP